MRLTQDDLINYTKAMYKNTNWELEIKATKSESWFRTLEIKSNVHWISERIAWWLTLRESYEVLRWVYATYNFLITNQL